jgi:colanic acid/amylovoran biosynthesis glycosyltransferase
MPTVASYCTTFLKPEMLHIYRQVTGLQDFETFVVTKHRQSEEKFPFADVEMAPDVRSNFVRRFWLKYVKKEPPIVYRGEYGVLNRLLERRDADLMHVYFGHTGVHLLPFIKRWPKPVVVSFHGMDIMPREDKPGYLDNLKDLLQTIPLVMARSHSLKERMLDLGCPEEKFRLNRTGIPLGNFPFVERQPPQDGAWHFVQACRLVEKKGLDVALKAFARFAASRPGARFTIAGDGPLRETLDALVVELELLGKVSFAGFLSEGALRDLYHSAHAFVHPSQITEDQNQEGIPNSMLEAMSTGLPVLATHHGGIPEAVNDGAAGLLSAERDVDGLLDHMERLAADTGAWGQMGQRASADMHENFEQSAQVKKLEDVYRELLEGHGGS